MNSISVVDWNEFFLSCQQWETSINDNFLSPEWTHPHNQMPPGPFGALKCILQLIF